MNLLAVDATSSLIKFAIYAHNSSLELILTGSFDSEQQLPLTIRDSAGCVLTKLAVPARADETACLCLVMQWLDSRQIRIDAIAHLTAPKMRKVGMDYLVSAYHGVPHVACSVISDDDDLLSLAEAAMLNFAIPVTCPNAKSVRVRCASCSAT